MSTQAERAAAVIDPEPPEVQARVLLVDDDAGIRAGLSDYLQSHNVSVEAVNDIVALDEALEKASYDVIILDVVLPGESGLDACIRISRAIRTPIILISAMGTDVDRIVGLELGADLYLAKPFNPRELLASIRALVRRRNESPSGSAAAVEFWFSGWRLNVSRHHLFTPAGVLVALSAYEFRTFLAFVERPLQILSRDRILDLVRSEHADVYDRVVDVVISRLRRKLSLGEGGEKLIETVRSEGYRFTAPVVRR
jgi:two-component system OmpR family response regulator